MTPFRMLQLVWEQRSFVVRFTLASFILFTVIAFLLPKHYIATTHLMPPDYGSNLQMALALPALDEGSAGGGGTGSGSGGSIMGLASQFLGLSTSGELYIGVIQSETIESHIISKFDLMNLYSAHYLQDAREQLEKRTEVKSDRRSGIISISVEDKSPQRAAAIAQEYVKQLDQVLASVNTSAAHRERVFIEGRLGEVKQELDASAKEFARFSSQNAAIDVPEQAKAMVGAAAELQAELIAAQSELKGLQQIYTDTNVRVKTLQAHVAELQRQVNKFGGIDVDPTQDGALEKGELYPSIRQLPLLGVKYLDLYRRNKVEEAVFEFLTREFEIAKVEEARELPSVQVLDPAMAPDKKSSPHRLLIMAFGLFLGFAVSSIWITSESVWNALDQSDPRRVLALNVFYTTTSHIRGARVFRQLRPLRMRISAALTSPKIESR
jgi:uncharacterized protein involved in exopolysaccharide biosynthesis